MVGNGEVTRVQGALKIVLEVVHCVRGEGNKSALRKWERNAGKL